MLKNLNRDNILIFPLNFGEGNTLRWVFHKILDIYALNHRLQTDMKRIQSVGILGLLSVLIAACSGMNNSKGIINGHIEGAAGQTVYLQRYVNSKPVITDSAKVEANGNFEIVPAEGLELNFYSLKLGDDKGMVVITDSSECLHIHTKFEDFDGEAIVTGSQHTSLLLNFHKDMISRTDEILTTQAKANNPSTTKEEQRSLQAQLVKKRIEKRKACLDFIETEMPSPAVLAALSELDIKKDQAQYERVREGLKNNFSHSYYYKMVDYQIKNASKQQQVRKQPNTKYSAGMMAPDIEMPNPDRANISLSDLRGNIVMIDFWASWCGPCRRENPRVVEAYKKYNKYGFEVFSVSLDKTVDKWKQAIEKDNLIWPYHVSDLKGWQNAAAQNYGVSSIPHTVLLDKEGKIIATHIRGSALEAQLKEIFGH